MSVITDPHVLGVIDSFNISDEMLRTISAKIEEELKSGLAQVGGSSIAMIPSFVPELPDGSEAGQYVVIDLSGKNLRIMLMTLKGASTEPDIASNNYVIPNPVMNGTGEKLFTFIVNSLQKFLAQFDLVDANLPIGFVFSYPCELLSIRSAKLLWWTKSFDIADLLNKDVVKLLQDALELNMNTRATIKAVMNDTVGQLAAAAHKYGPECTIGVVIGYGCNSSYLERTERITKFDAAAHDYHHKHMVVVTEWEEFGANGELEDILTPFDRDIDRKSVHQGKQMIDKLTGALYLGELVRHVLSQLVLDRVLFDGQPCEKLEEPDQFPTKYILEILRAPDVNRACRRVCDELEVPSHSALDYQVIYQVCHVVSLRSASIVAAAIGALLRHVDCARVKIGVGGALVQFHPTYMPMLKEKLELVAPASTNWEIVPYDEGSARGAAFVAAVADRLHL